MSDALTAVATAVDSTNAVPRHESEEEEPKSRTAATKASPLTSDWRPNFHVPFW